MESLKFWSSDSAFYWINLELVEKVQHFAEEGDKFFTLKLCSEAEWYILHFDNFFIFRSSLIVAESFEESFRIFVIFLLSSQSFVENSFFIYFNSTCTGPVIRLIKFYYYGSNGQLVSYERTGERSWCQCQWSMSSEPPDPLSSTPGSLCPFKSVLPNNFRNLQVNHNYIFNDKQAGRKEKLREN